MSVPKLTRWYSALVVVAVATLPLTAQFATPPFNPAEPAVLSRSSQGVQERLDTRKWRSRYNQFELIVQVWQIYYARKKGADWKEIFQQVSGLMESEISLHTDYYNGLSQADALVTSYYKVDDIRKEFKAIIAIVPALVEATSDRQVWTDLDEVKFICNTGREIEKQAIATLKYVTLVSGVEIDAWDGVADAGVESTREKYWASTADRLQHLDRMQSELTTLRTLLDNLYRRAQQTTLSRHAQQNEYNSAIKLFSFN